MHLPRLGGRRHPVAGLLQLHGQPDSVHHLQPRVQNGLQGDPGWKDCVQRLLNT